MLERAKGYDLKLQADIADWIPKSPPALVFSNAGLHWVPDHAMLFPRLAGLLAPGGCLAVQMPRQQMAPSHALLREIAARLFPDRFDPAGWRPQVSDPAAYHDLLSPSGRVEIWETEYLQTLAAVEEGHPVRAFTASTAMRPFIERLSDSEARIFVAAYDAALFAAYPPGNDGSVLFPFRRLFVVLSGAG